MQKQYPEEHKVHSSFMWPETEISSIFFFFLEKMTFFEKEL